MLGQREWMLLRVMSTLILFALLNVHCDNRLTTVHSRSPLLASRKRIGNPRTSISSPPEPETESSKFNHETFRSQPTTDRTPDGMTVSLNCLRDRMQLDVTFQQPFRGVIAVGRPDSDNRRQKMECQVRGNGSNRYQMDISHLNCGTHFNDRSGHFSNTLFIRHHPTLETGADHSKTLLCKFGLAQFNVM